MLPPRRIANLAAGPAVENYCLVGTGSRAGSESAGAV